MQTVSARMDRITNRFYDGGHLPTGKREPLSESTAVGNLRFHDHALDVRFPGIDNGVDRFRGADLDPTQGAIKTDYRTVSYEGSTDSGRYRVRDKFPGDQTNQATLFMDNAVVGLDLYGYADGEIEGQLQYLDRKDPSKSFTQELSQEWLLSQ
jgi:hypothetical protein